MRLMNHTRLPVAAGMFYSFGKNELQKELSRLFISAKPKIQNSIGIVSPHAGYAYSGRTAALAISSLKPAKSFVILGPNHSGIGAEFAVMSRGEWQTPLGECMIDSALVKDIDCDVLEDDPDAHQNEHSIEVQLPLLQHHFGKFRFVPVSITNISYDSGFLSRCEKLGKAIAHAIRKGNTGIIASSDFSHHIPARTAERIDRGAIERITRLDTKGFFSFLEENHASVCGYGPVAVLMSAARALGLRAELMEYTHSGKTTGDFDSVVGYASIGFRKK